MKNVENKIDGDFSKTKIGILTKSQETKMSSQTVDMEFTDCKSCGSWLSKAWKEFSYIHSMKNFKPTKCCRCKESICFGCLTPLGRCETCQYKAEKAGFADGIQEGVEYSGQSYGVDGGLFDDSEEEENNSEEEENDSEEEKEE